MNAVKRGNRQLALIRGIVEARKPFHFAFGVQGEGKTAAALEGMQVRSLAYPGNYALVARTKTLARESLVPAFRKAAKRIGYAGEIKVENGSAISFGGSRFIILAGADANTPEYIQSMNLSGALVDEVFNIKESVLMELDGRLREGENQVMVMTGNPGLGNHYFKRSWLDRKDEIGMEVYFFQQGENPGISDSVRKRQDEVAYGGWFDRRRRGLFAPLTGLCYPKWHRVLEVPGEITKYAISVDPGDSSVTHALLFGYASPTWYVLDEWVHDVAIEGMQLAHDEQAEYVLGQLAKNLDLSHIVTDVANRSFRNALRDRFPKVPVLGSYKSDDLSQDIFNAHTVLYDGAVKLVKGGAPKLEDELYSYGWDENAAQKRGVTKPMDMRDHGVDALRYFILTKYSMPKTRLVVRQ